MLLGKRHPDSIAASLMASNFPLPGGFHNGFRYK
jgi:hypothetical protein